MSVGCHICRTAGDIPSVIRWQSQFLRKRIRRCITANSLCAGSVTARATLHLSVEVRRLAMVPCPALLIFCRKRFIPKFVYRMSARKGAEEEVAYTDAYDAKIEEVQNAWRRFKTSGVNCAMRR